MHIIIQRFMYMFVAFVSTGAMKDDKPIFFLFQNGGGPLLVLDVAHRFWTSSFCVWPLISSGMLLVLNVPTVTSISTRRARVL